MALKEIEMGLPHRMHLITTPIGSHLAVAFNARLSPTMIVVTAHSFWRPMVWKVSMMPRTVPSSPPLEGAFAATVPITTKR